ncbi:putative ATP-dependent helicase DinG [compost metagenome]
MGKVIPISVATRVDSSDSVLTFIDECYDRLAKLPGFIVREGQKRLSREVCKAMVAGEPIAAEAPTGTGKTIAYLIGAIAASEKLRTTKEIPVVVATATVGLQTQIMQGDLPSLVNAGILASEREAVLAKGRGRYFCMASAERLSSEKSSDGQHDFFDQTINENVQLVEEVNTMLELWDARVWNGDIDSYPLVAPATWREVAASSETCLGHKCEFYSECPFFQSRRALSEARIIVANHDLVLSDLAMDQEGIDPLFPGGRYLVVFDEAHHLPDKAIDVGSAQLQIEEAKAGVGRLAGFNKSWQRKGDIVRLFEKSKLQPHDFDTGPLFNGLDALREELAKVEVEPETLQFRFPRGEVPDSILKAAENSLDHARLLANNMSEAAGALKKTNLPEKQPELKGFIGELLFQCAFLNSQLAAVVKALSLFSARDRAVRWIFRASADQVSIHVSPLEGADVLRRLLWSSERAVVAMVSATLQDFNGFDRFKARSGVGDNLRTMKLDPIFPYRENTLQLVDMKYSPRQAERAQFITELAANLPAHINAAEGTLVLFPSRSMMKALVPELRKKFGHSVMAQGDKGIKELIADHRQRIDDGKGSILCGLATMAEGLDLPGKYCVHVAICSLPFAVPTSPVEQELAEVLGKEYFAQRALPDALTKLIQMVGRLMRRESDRGRITVYDHRLIYTQWGRKMLNALPNFRRKVVASALAAAPSRKPEAATA